MDNLDESENNAKISDSGYSNSCSNSQSRRSHSSKSTHSGSNSSGSSGYGGQPSTSSSSNNLVEPPKKKKEPKKKKTTQNDTLTSEDQTETETSNQEPAAIPSTIEEEDNNDLQTASPVAVQTEKVVENMEVSVPETTNVTKEIVPSKPQHSPHTTVNVVTSRPAASFYADRFSCIISMHDGVVRYTTPSLTATLGFPKEMWIGRSFIDFVHPRDRDTFASQITRGLAVPKIVNGALEKAQSGSSSGSTMVCRVRRYRGLACGFGVKERVVTFMPFLLNFTFKNICDEEGNVIYLVIQATPYFSAFKIPNELLSKTVPFVLRHSANGVFEYIDPESVPYLGYMPQDIQDKDALQFYHPDDLEYLQQIYEAIIKEGGLSRSKPYRMLVQNGGYIIVESEWSSFINPWSRKLEFITVKYQIIQGPPNPDVFQSADPEKATKLTEEQQKKVDKFRECILKIMSGALTKPAELAKQQMTKRCQDLATIMESLIEEQPKDDDMRNEIQPDHSYYERDSVILGGISPHHDYNDSKSSTETPLSYNQLNYNATLDRYFTSHQPFIHNDSDFAVIHKVVVEPKPVSSLSPMASGDSGDLTSSCDSATPIVSGASLRGNYQAVRLTENLLTKHNTEMEKELVKLHRETRSSNKSEREKTSNGKQKKKEHFARCNASFQPTGLPTIMETQVHGVKRTFKQFDGQVGEKHQCPSKVSRRRNTTSAAPTQPSSTITNNVASTQWPSNSDNNTNTFILGLGIPPPMPMISPVPAVPGMFPMYYAQGPTPVPPIPVTTEANSQPDRASNSNVRFPTPSMPCVMYGQPMYGSPFVYSPMGSQVSYPLPQTVLQQNMYTNTLNPLCLTNSNYEEACKTSILPRPTATRRVKKQNESRTTKNDNGSANTNSSTNAMNRSGDAGTNSKSPATDAKSKTSRIGNSVERTDGESSCSSFYSSFFKTESCSGEESSEAKNAENNLRHQAKKRGEDAMLIQNPKGNPSGYYEPSQKVPRRKMEPPWMNQVCVTSELIYNYQLVSKPLDEVLSAEKEKLKNIEQPNLVNEQLGQLYLDLQLEGVAARLTLEEGITSSSSSGEETTNPTKQKFKYNKLVMIHEENAPLPPPDDAMSTCSKS